MRKKRNNKTNKTNKIKPETTETTETTETINTNTNDTNNTEYIDKNTNDIYNEYINNDSNDNLNDNSDNNINALKDNEDDKKGLNKKILKMTPTDKAIQARKQQWKEVPVQAQNNVIDCIMKEFKNLNLNRTQIIHHLKLLYISNQKHITALEKIQDNNTLSSKDFLPTDDSIEVTPVFYPQVIDTLYIDQILTDRQSAFLNNIRNGMDKKQAFLDAGYAPSKLPILQAITQTNPDRFNVEYFKPYKKIWFEYWKIQKEKSEASGITEDYILSGFKKTVDFNVKDLFDSQGNYKNINDLDDETAKQITEIKISESRVTNNKTKQTTTTTTTMMIKTGNKDKAREHLAKLQEGIFNHVKNKTMNINHNHSGAVLHGQFDASKLSNDQLDRILLLDMKANDDSLDMDECYDHDAVEEAEVVQGIVQGAVQGAVQNEGDN